MAVFFIQHPKNNFLGILSIKIELKFENNLMQILFIWSACSLQSNAAKKLIAMDKKSNSLDGEA